MTTPNNKEAKEQALQAEEIKEWREKLSAAKNVKQECQVITDILKAMSAGRDVSELFSDVLKLMQTRDLKLKKMIYIFLTSNAQGNTEQAFLCVNALELDSNDKDSAIIRATAIRTMGSVATPDTCEYFTGPVSRGLTDSDPFVRKCAATCVAKLFKIKREAIQDSELIRAIRNTLTDGNQAVVAAAAGTLMSIANMITVQEYPEYLGISAEDTVFNQTEVRQLMTVLSEATEWSALSILEAISKYGAIPTVEDMEIAVQRLSPFLKHSNPSVCLNAINVLLRYSRAGILQPAEIMNLQNQCLQSVVSLISQHCAPEIEWISLRSLRLIAKIFQGPDPFGCIQKNIRLFFVRYNDELYIKLEKIEALALVCNRESAFDVVKELTEYCEDVHPTFVRAAIRVIGRIACKIPEAVDYCVEQFMTLLTGENEKGEKLNFVLPSYAAQELMIAIQDIFRTYPERYERVIGALCESISSYDDPQAKASLIWILGEYCTRIEGTEEILMDLCDIDMESGSLGSFAEDPVVIQLNLITAVAKIYISSKTQITQALFNGVMNKAAKDLLSPDVRARAAFFLRLVQMDPSLEIAQQVVFVKKPAPSYGDGLSQKVGAELAAELGSISATLRELVNFKKEEELDSEEVVRQFGALEVEEYVPEEIEPQAQRLPQVEPAPLEPQPESEPQPQPASQPALDDIFGDLLGPSKPAQQPQQPEFETNSSAPVEQPAEQSLDLDDIFGLGQPQEQAQPQPEEQSVEQEIEQQPATNNFLDSTEPFITSNVSPLRMRDPSQPIKLQVAWTRQGGAPFMLVQLKNEAEFPIQGAQITLQPNVFGYQVVNKTLPMIPAMGIYNGGEWHQLQLEVTQTHCSFPAQRMGNADPNLQIGMNLITFGIQIPNGPLIQYQTKCFVPSAFIESSAWHGSDRKLNDQYEANMALNETWNSWPELSGAAEIPYQQLGVADQTSAVQAVTQKLHRINLNYINLFQDRAEYAVNFQVNVSSGNKNELVFVKVFFQQGNGAIACKVAVRCPSEHIIVASYVLAGILEVLNEQ